MNKVNPNLKSNLDKNIINSVNFQACQTVSKIVRNAIAIFKELFEFLDNIRFYPSLKTSPRA